MIVLLFGPPGCGKGTQAAFIACRFGIPSVSTGELLRAECKAGTDLGKIACAVLKSGGLLDDATMEQLVAARTARQDCAHGFLLDGFPRTLDQARFLDRLLASRGLPPPIAIRLDVPAPLLVSRITARRQCSLCARIYNLDSQPPTIDGICDADGAPLIRREDDIEAVVTARLKAYDDATGPAIAYYRNAGCHSLDGAAAPGQISREIERLLVGATVAVL